MKAVNILEQLHREPSNDIPERVDLIHPTEIMHKFLFIHELTLVICCLRSPSSFSVLIICPIGYANVTAAVLVHILHIFCYYLETRILGCLSRHREHIVKDSTDNYSNNLPTGYVDAVVSADMPYFMSLLSYLRSELTESPFKCQAWCRFFSRMSSRWNGCTYQYCLILSMR